MQKIPSDQNGLSFINCHRDKSLVSPLISTNKTNQSKEILHQLPNITTSNTDSDSEEVRTLLTQLNIKREGLEKKMSVLQNYKSALLRKMDQINLHLNPEASTSLTSSDRTDSKDSGVASIHNDYISKPKHLPQNPVKSILKKTSPSFDNQQQCDYQQNTQKDKEYQEKMIHTNGSDHIFSRSIKRPISVDDQLFQSCIDRSKSNCKSKNNNYNCDELLDFIDDRSSDPPSPAPRIPEQIFSYPCQYLMK